MNQSFNFFNPIYTGLFLLLPYIYIYRCPRQISISHAFYFQGNVYMVLYILRQIGKINERRNLRIRSNCVMYFILDILTFDGRGRISHR